MQASIGIFTYLQMTQFFDHEWTSVWLVPTYSFEFVIPTHMLDIVIDCLTNNGFIITTLGAIQRALMISSILIITWNLLGLIAI